jgi:hypothetical protein
MLPKFLMKLVQLSEMQARRRAHLTLQVYQFPQVAMTCIWVTA